MISSAIEVLHSVVLYPTFSEEALKLSNVLMTITAQYGLNIPSNLLGSIIYCRRVAISIQPLLYDGVLVG